MKFSGSCVTVATPFNSDRSINYDKLKELVKRRLAEGGRGKACCALEVLR